MDNLRQIKHLYARAGFGLTVGEMHSAGGLSTAQALASLFKTAENFQPVDIVKGEAKEAMLVKGDKAEKQQFMKRQAQEEKSLNGTWR